MSAPAPVAPGFIAVNTAMLWLTMAIAATALWPIYETERLILLVGVTLVAGSLIGILGAVYRLPSLMVMLATIFAYFLLGVPLAVPDRALFGVLPSLQGLLDLLLGTALGWKQLVTITLPVGAFESLLVPAFLLLLVGTVVALSVALRAKFGEIVVVVPIALFLTAVMFGPAQAAWPVPLAIALLVTCLIWLIWARWYRRRASIRLLIAQPGSGEGRAVNAHDTRLGYRAVIGAALSMVVAITAGVAAVSLFPPAVDRHVLRTSIEKPFDPRDYVSPLSGLRGYHQAAKEDQAMFTVVGLPQDGRIRIATLDTYDGIVYAVGSDQLSSESGSFVRVPTSFDQSALRGEQVELEVTIEQYGGIWMPTVGQLESVTFSGGDAAELRASFFYNDNGGTAAVVNALSGGDSYLVRAVIPAQPSARQLANLEPGTARVPRVGLLPEELAVALGRYVGDAGTSGARLQAMLNGLRSDGYLSHGVGDEAPLSRSGHAADRITQLLTEQRMIGDEEQYAVTAALMAGELGFPARIVFGFAPSSINETGATTIRGGDVSAWIEVNTNRFGWVALDPTPQPREIPDEKPEEPTQVARPQSPVQPPINEPDLQDNQIPPESTQEDPELPDPLLAILLTIAQATGVVVLGLAILLSPFLAIVLAKIRRRSLRQRAPAAADRISGGWQEFEDSVLDHGFAPPPAPTRSEVARTIGGVRPLVLASIADRAVFSPDASVDAEADQVWRSVEEIRTALNQGLTRWQRIKALISVRSLGGYSVKSLFRR